MMKMLKYIALTVVAFQLTSCGGSDDVNDMTPSEPDLEISPFAAVLIFPENNSECNEGVIISETESKVIFRWEESQNTDIYTVNLKNLDTDVVQNLNSNGSELEIILQRGAPYSWSVKSSANGSSNSANSDIWKFYNAGLAIENYAPFPAEAVNPAIGAAVNSGMTELIWTGSDLDNDIESYDIYIDSNNPPTTFFGSSTTTSLNYDAANSGITYYWRVVTKDSQGNSSNSEIFSFEVN